MNYFKQYYRLVNKAHLEKRVKHAGVYYESHHVKPECKGGKFLVLLTGREHFIAHLLLTKIYKDDYQLSSAFNKMFSCSKEQDRYMPVSRWFEYKRKLFSKNHPLKDPIIREKHRQAMIKWNKKNKNKCRKVKLGAICELHKCKHCNKLIKNTRQYCSKECHVSYKEQQKKLKNPELYKMCPICGDEHTKKYCCSKECFNEYIKLPNNEYSKTLSSKRSKYIRENLEKIKKSAQKNAGSRDQKKIGRKISETKRKNKSGNNLSSSFEIRIYNPDGVLQYTSPKTEKLDDFFDKTQLTKYLFVNSYRFNTKINVKSGKNTKYNGWYAIKVKE